MKTNLRKIVVPLLQTFSLALTVGLATPEKTFAQPVTTFTKVTTGHIATNLSSSFGAAWGDYNNDGFEDLFVANVGGRNDSLYLNNTNGTFTPILTGEIVNDGKQSFSANWGDYDNDGWLDLFVTIRGFPETNRLYHNVGDGTFVKVTSGDIVTDSHNGYMFGSAWGDYDNDGFIDLFVSKTGGGIAAGKRDLLYRNDSAGSFNRIVTGPIVQVSDVSSGCAWGDYNNDGKLDLFVVNTTTNFLFRNDGNGVFSQITTGAIATDKGVSESPAWGDYNNDGFLDLFVAYGGPGAVSTNALYQNTGTGTFARVTSGIIATDAGNFVGCAWGDYDNDGFLDLFVSQYLGKKNVFYRNNGDGTFSRITSGSIVNDPGDSNGTVWGDYDNDGFLDLFVTNGSTETTQYTNFLYHNDGNSNQWLKIKCVGGPSNRAAIGAKVRVQAQNGVGALMWQMREISGGNGLSQNSLVAHFGLGSTTNAPTVRIEWPSGIVQTLTNVASKQFLTVNEPPLLQTGMTNGSFQLLLTGSIGLAYEVEASTDFTAWTSLGTITNSSRTMPFVDSIAATQPQRFYRAVLK